MKLHPKGFLTLRLFKKAGYREKRYRKKYKMVSFIFDIILKSYNCILSVHTYCYRETFDV